MDFDGSHKKQNATQTVTPRGSAPCDANPTIMKGNVIKVVSSCLLTDSQRKCTPSRWKFPKQQWQCILNGF